MAVSLREVLSFGRYEPLFRIASGGMAEVYAAQIQGEAGFQKLVAVKRMHPHLAHDQSFVDMFLNEARLAAHVTSPHVVQTMDLGRGSDGSLYIVMELVVGVSLATLEVASQAALPVPIALELVAQAAHGLDDAHDAVTPAGDELGLIHRDVSPHNILVGIDGRAKVTDFGIARAVHAPRTETNVKELKGKFAYMSPEQTRLHRLDRRSDIFSLGIVLWEALVGRRLFAERDPADCIRNVRKKVIPPPHELDPHIPPAISKVVLTALERMPSARYQTGADFADALRRVGRDELGRLPDRKTIAAFVKEAGGEELERLQRLIRLGTEGAASEAMEAVRPGSTMVLGPGDASGVARVGTTRTDEMDPTSLPKIATVILPDEEEERLGSTATEADLDDADLEFLHLAEHHTPLLESEELLLEDEEPEEDPVALHPTRRFEKPVAPVAAPRLTSNAPEAPPTRRPWLLAGGLALTALVAAGALGAIVLTPDEPETVLPSAAPLSRRAPPPADAPLPPPPVREPATTEPPRAEPEALAREADAPEETDTAPTSGTTRRRHRRRARTTEGRGSSRSSASGGEGPVLLDVNAFDHVGP